MLMMMLKPSTSTTRFSSPPYLDSSMGPSIDLFTGKVLPSIIFPSLSLLASYIIISHAIQSGFMDLTLAKCFSPGDSPLSLKYTGIGLIDHLLCGLVAVFHALMHPSNLDFNVVSLSAFSTVVALPVLEAARRKSHDLLAFHVVISLISQCCTAAVVFPCFYLLFITTGSAQTNSGPGARISQARAEAVFLSVILGYLIPSAAMLVLGNPYVTAFWQLFPLWMFFIERVYLTIRPSSQDSGYRTVQTMHATLFLITATAHFYSLGPIILAGDHARIRAFFLPSLSPTPVSAPVPVRALHLVQWDMVFVWLSTLFASLWTAKSVSHFFRILLWIAVGAGVLGPGATFAIISAWRERHLNGAHASKGKKRTEEKQD